MSLRRPRPLSDEAARGAVALKRIERQTALLDRVRPRNFEAERVRLLAAWRAGRRCQPQFEYSPKVDLHQERTELAAVMRSLDVSEDEQALLLERAEEMQLEAELVECVGTAKFRELAARRFPLPAGGAARNQAAHIAAAQQEDDDASTLHSSDDRHDPASLWSLVVELISRERLPVRVEVTAGLVSLAAVADGVVRIRAGARLSAAVGRRVAVHEVEGHVRPRLAGRALGGVFWAGSAGANEDEEGRALWLEQRAGLLDAGRRRELGRRYLAAESVREGADPWQTIRLLVDHGSTDVAAIELACRAHRGGGLGRELIYLTGYDRVSRAFAGRAELERVLGQGRLSVVAAARLLDAGSIELDDDGNVV